MKITLTDIHWRNQDDSDIFNIHAVGSIELDLDKNVVTINGIKGLVYKSPFCELTFGGGVTHFEFTCMRPYTSKMEFISVAVFERNGVVAVASRTPFEEGHWFLEKCKRFYFE